jgi:hypothetical protein
MRRLRPPRRSGSLPSSNGPGGSSSHAGDTGSRTFRVLRGISATTPDCRRGVTASICAAAWSKRALTTPQRPRDDPRRWRGPSLRFPPSGGAAVQRASAWADRGSVLMDTSRTTSPAVTAAEPRRRGVSVAADRSGWARPAGLALARGPGSRPPRPAATAPRRRSPTARPRGWGRPDRRTSAEIRAVARVRPTEPYTHLATGFAL